MHVLVSCFLLRFFLFGVNLQQEHDFNWPKSCFCLKWDKKWRNSFEKVEGQRKCFKIVLTVISIKYIFPHRNYFEVNVHARERFEVEKSQWTSCTKWSWNISKHHWLQDSFTARWLHLNEKYREIPRNTEKACSERVVHFINISYAHHLSIFINGA